MTRQLSLLKQLMPVKHCLNLEVPVHKRKLVFSIQKNIFTLKVERDEPVIPSESPLLFPWPPIDRLNIGRHLRIASQPEMQQMASADRRRMEKLATAYRAHAQ